MAIDIGRDYLESEGWVLTSFGMKWHMAPWWLWITESSNDKTNSHCTLPQILTLYVQHSHHLPAHLGKHHHLYVNWVGCNLVPVAIPINWQMPCGHSNFPLGWMCKNIMFYKHNIARRHLSRVWKLTLDLNISFATIRSKKGAHWF